jgi:riboflavin kinase / FMN adenylyltransferase
VVLTFFPHPSKILRPLEPVPRLFSLKNLEHELRQLGVDVLIAEPFTFNFAAVTAEKFISEYVVPHLHPKEVIVGYDFAFGSGREGTFSILESLGSKNSFTVKRVEPVSLGGEIVSSTLIRKYLAEGELDKAAALLGRTYSIDGYVVSGEGRGSQIGFATANIHADTEVLPATGVYITRLQIDGVTLPSVTNIGHKPTFHEKFELTIESHILNNFNANIYSKNIKLEFLRRLRPELKFPSRYELMKQIELDVAETKKYFGL